MALTYVGGTTSSTVGSTSTNLTVSLTSLSGGSASAPAEGDIVIVSYATGSNADGDLSPVTSGYTRHCDLYADDSYDTNLWVATKIMGSTPDTSVVLPPSGSTSDAITVSVQVWRASSGNKIYLKSYDVLTATGIDTGRPTPPAITPTITGSIVVCAGAGAYSSIVAEYTSSNLSNFTSKTQADTNSSYLGMGSFAWTVGTFTPASFGGGVLSAYASWCAYSLILSESPTTPLLNKDLIAYWKLEGNSKSETGYQYDGTDTDITYSDTDGLQGKYALFNGTSSEINNFTNITIPQTNFAYSFWFKTSSASGKKIIGAENVLTGTTGANYDKLVYIGTDGKLYAGVYNGAVRYITSSNTVNDNKWHYVVFTSNTTTTYLYLDGSLVGSTAYISADSGSKLRIGSYKLSGWINGSDGYYDGNVDELAIWNRALTGEEIQQLFYAGNGNTYPFQTNMADFM